MKKPTKRRASPQMMCHRSKEPFAVCQSLWKKFRNVKLTSMRATENSPHPEPLQYSLLKLLGATSYLKGLIKAGSSGSGMSI